MVLPSQIIVQTDELSDLIHREKVEFGAISISKIRLDV